MDFITIMSVVILLSAMSRSNINEADEGKNVVDSTGQQLGTVSKFEGGMAYVKPDENMGESIRSKLGWADDSQNEFELLEDQIQEVTDNEVRLNESS